MHRKSIARAGILSLLSLATGVSILGLAIQSAVAAEKPSASFHVPIEYYKLPNGLRVVLSQDHTAPTVCVGVYYRIGFRVEPRDRTGFAHLFEHMMFQGSSNLGKMEFIKLIQSNGGILNGSTRFDFTNYYEVVPSNKLETILWAEGDRMSGLAVNDDNLKNQQGVVGNEVKVNVLNAPYGGFPWIDMPMAANSNWYNAHNFYGDLTDIESAKLDEVKKFFSTYYAPNNAALVVVGDFEAPEAKKFIEKYFGAIPSSQLPAQPDLTEPRQETEKITTKVDPLAPKPAIAIGYHMPERNTPAYYAMGLIEEMLLEGDDALLRKELVQKRGLTDSVSGGINLLGNMYDYGGPMLLITDLRYDAATKPETILAAMDAAIDPLRAKPVDKQLLDRARVKLRSDLYDTLGQIGGLGLTDLLATAALFDDNPARINSLVSEFDKVTPELIQKTAEEYLRPGNRTVIELQTKPKTPAPAAGQ
jgi:predicted Zn-dependent peptidase